jgi:hypothetical protein
MQDDPWAQRAAGDRADLHSHVGRITAGPPADGLLKAMEPAE